MPSIKSPCDGTLVPDSQAISGCSLSLGRWILAATILASSMAFIDSTVVNVAIPTLQTAFRATIVEVQWVVESYGLTLSALILAGGALGDLFGRRLVFLSGVIVFAGASAACGLAPSILALVVARSVQGIGAALLIPGSLAIISASFDEKARGKAIGTWSGFTAITMAFGPVLGGWLIEHGSWRWAFFLNVPLAVAVLAISLWRVPESRGASARRIDWIGTSLVTFGLGGVVTAFLESAKLGWSSFLVVGSLIAGVVCLILFVAVELRTTSPLVPPELFKSRSFLGANLLTLVLYAAIGIFFFLFPTNLIRLHGYSATAAGAAALPMILLMFFLSPWSGSLVSRVGGKVPLTGGPLIVAAAFTLFAFLPAGASYWTTIFPSFLILGFGMTVTVAPLTTVMMASVEQNHAGAASGINNAVARVAGVLAIAVFGLVMVNAFGSSLDRGLAKISLNQNTVHDIQAKKIELAAIETPRELDSESAAAVQRAIFAAFDHGLRIVLVCCAGLSVASAAIAWGLIGTEESARIKRVNNGSASKW